MTPEKILNLVDDINLSLVDADITVQVKELIDPEDWQEIAGVYDASEDKRYYFPSAEYDYDEIEKE